MMIYNEFRLIELECCGVVLLASEADPTTNDLRETIACRIGDGYYRFQLVWTEGVLKDGRPSCTVVSKDTIAPSKYHELSAEYGTRDTPATNLKAKKRRALEQQWEELVPRCPECEAPMTRCTSTEKGRPFFGCTKFPDCRGYRRFVHKLWDEISALEQQIYEL